jgi:radical SAM protein with 4Fe4S-binding SPASM domain
MRLDGGPKPGSIRIPPEEVVALDMADEKRKNEWRDFMTRFWGPPHQPDFLYQCGAGLGTFHINSYGLLSACTMARQPSFDLNQGSFHEGWFDFMPQVLAQKWIKDVPCKHCDLSALCSQCPGLAQLEHGDQETPVEYFCQIAHLRAETLELSQ